MMNANDILRGRLWVGSLLIIAAGVLILLSTFMAWSPATTGWNYANLRTLPSAGGSANAFFYNVNGVMPIYTGFWTLVWGGLIALSGIALLFTRGYGVRTFVMILAIIGLFFSIVNMVALAQAGLGVSYGAGIFLIFSSIAVVGAALALPLLSAERGAHPYQLRVKPGMVYEPERHRGAGRTQAIPESHTCLAGRCLAI